MHFFVHRSIHQEHGQKKLFLCPECGREFTEQYYLKRHQLRHSGVKKYSCHLCPSKFTFQNGLTSHMSTHTGEKPHLCSMCNASFAKAKSLKSHERLHTGVRPYACNQCGKRWVVQYISDSMINTCRFRFNESGHLTRHLRTHTVSSFSADWNSNNRDCDFRGKNRTNAPTVNVPMLRATIWWSTRELTLVSF